VRQKNAQFANFLRRVWCETCRTCGLLAYRNGADPAVQHNESLTAEAEVQASERTVASGSLGQDADSYRRGSCAGTLEALLAGRFET
jgi:hypothetical protein